MPKVTILMPVFNNACYLTEAIDSILNQTFLDFEFIIICEYGSDKDTVSILKRFENIDNRIKVIYNTKKLGVAASLNKGIGYSKGMYIARMDADDISLKDRIRIQTDFMDKNLDIAICGCEVDSINENNEIIAGRFDKFPRDSETIKAGMLFYCYLRHPTVMMRKQALIDYNLEYNEDYLATEDFELWARATHLVKITNLSTVLLRYRLHKDNATEQNKTQGIENYIKVMDWSFKNLGIEFNREELLVLCPLTCKVNEMNKKYIKNTLISCEKKIIKANEIRNIYTNASLTNALKTRVGWTKHPIRHLFISFMRKILLAIKRKF